MDSWWFNCIWAHVPGPDFVAVGKAYLSMAPVCVEKGWKPLLLVVLEDLGGGSGESGKWPAVAPVCVLCGRDRWETFGAGFP